ncbi:chemotaxis protein CheW [Agrobacterium vitis]|uniref:chemotaxis protein CheW n=1 Tax=Agrobacterium vitis TaxID=373 RepID=UPI0015DA9E0B|nr:chemotaxis protein CheW [Agrobacterium vitis]MCF1452809.1 purine-binding chemotaxis protein CheW [Agrobacterium vitis]MCF1465586.1 purine-binding chemotaxis protein CheW [Agrobacterium vitis]BCH56553.1 chemotaxis protein CheW [Agrobacterium vitis]
MRTASTNQADALEILAFKLHGQEFCVKTTSIREIRGWAPATSLPHAPQEVVGVINLRGTVIPIVDLAVKLGMASMTANERSAIIVAEVDSAVVGLLVDAVSDILTVPADSLQPVPQATSTGTDFSDGIIVQDASMICFLNLERMFAHSNCGDWAIAA